jgi:predicted DNA-binding transcriptional regulator AlpA
MQRPAIGGTTSAPHEDPNLRDAIRYRALFEHGFSVRFFGSEYQSKELADCAIDAVSCALTRRGASTSRQEMETKPTSEAARSGLVMTDPVLWRYELQSVLCVSSETIRRWIKTRHLPAPDVALSKRTLGWRLSTLHAAGIKVPIGYRAGP